jgi:hypothetical protein
VHRKTLTLIALCCACSDDQRDDALLHPGVAVAASDAGLPSCSVEYPVFDQSASCLRSNSPVHGICVTTDTKNRGLYTLCMVSPEGVVSWAVVPTDVRIGGPGSEPIQGTGWTFAPVWLAQALHLPEAAAEIDQSCLNAINSERHMPPSCES